MANIDTSDIDDWAKTLLEYASSDMPKKSKKFMQNEGNKLKKKTLTKAKSLTKKKTGNYYKGIKRGKVYHYRDKNNNSVRVYGGSSHAHLIEYPHRIIIDGVEKGMTEGKYVFEKAAKEFEPEFNEDCEDFSEDILKELSK